MCILAFRALRQSVNLDYGTFSQYGGMIQMDNHGAGVTASGTEHPTDRRAMLAGLGGLAAGALLAGGRSAHAGPLTPPSGPIEPTMKRLDEVEPRIPIDTLLGSSNSVHRITRPGSYYLTGDIVGEAGKSAIMVLSFAGKATIDLNGYTIRGVDGSFVGITCLSSNPRLVIRNGQISGWGWRGVGVNCPMVLEDLRIEGNGQGQADHGGARGADTVAAQVRRCVFASNNGDGLRVGEGSLVDQCSANGNGGHGILLGDRSSIAHCVCIQNTLNGIDAESGCFVTRCLCNANQNNGVRAGTRCVVFENMSEENGLFGFEFTGDHNRCEANTGFKNSLEFSFAGTRNFIARNLAIGVGQQSHFSFDSPDGFSTSLFAPSWTIGNPANSSNPNANYLLI